MGKSVVEVSLKSEVMISEQLHATKGHYRWEFCFESVDWRSMGMSEGLELCLCGSEGSM